MTMRRLILLLLCALAMLPAAAQQTPFQSDEELVNWLTYYYKNPEPERIPEALKYMTQSGVLDSEKTRVPVMGFLSGVFRDNPDRLAQWVDMAEQLGDKHLGVIVLALWYSKLPEAQRLMFGLLDKHAQLKATAGFLYQGVPVLVEDIPLEHGAWVIDALWGKFVATGESAPIERLITALNWLDARDKPPLRMIALSARMTLLVHAAKHNRIFEILQESAQAQGGDQAVRLRSIVDDVKAELKRSSRPRPG